MKISKFVWRAVPIAIFKALLSFASAADLPTTRHVVAGLHDRVEILIDHWGVPHIYGPNQYAVYFGQGFNVGRDRLWQLDLWRRRGLGQLSKVFGPAYVDQ